MYYDKRFFEEPHILRLAQDLGGKYIIDFRKPAYGEKFVKDGLGLMISNGGKFPERFIVSSTPPQTPPPGAFGRVYSRGIKCDGTWIPLDFRVAKNGESLISGESSLVRDVRSNSEDLPRLIVQKIEKSVKSEEKEKQMFLTPEDLRKFRFEARAEEIYPNGVQIPAGYEIIDFCPPVKGEQYIVFGSQKLGTAHDYVLADRASSARLIVAPKAQRDWQAEIDDAAGGVNWKVPESWRVTGYGTPKKGQYYLSPGIGYTPIVACYDFTNSPFILVEKSPATFTFDGVTFVDAPEGWEFVRVGFLTQEEIAKGWKTAYLQKTGRICNLWDFALDDVAAIFRPAQKA